MNKIMKTSKPRLLSTIIAILLVLLLTACGGKDSPLAVPANTQAGDLVDIQP